MMKNPPPALLLVVQL